MCCAYNVSFLLVERLTYANLSHVSTQNNTLVFSAASQDFRRELRTIRHQKAARKVSANRLCSLSDHFSCEEKQPLHVSRVKKLTISRKLEPTAVSRHEALEARCHSGFGPPPRPQ